MRGIFGPLEFDELSDADRYDAKVALARGEPVPPPSGKPSDAWTQSEREGNDVRDARRRRRTEEDELIGAALTTFKKGEQDAIREGVDVVRQLDIATEIDVGGTKVLIGTPAQSVTDPVQSALAKIEEEKGNPPGAKFRWWSAVCLSLVDAFEVGVTVDTTGGPRGYVKLQGDKFLLAFVKYRRESSANE